MTEKDILKFCVDLRNSLLAENENNSTIQICSTSQTIDSKILSSVEEFPEQNTVRKDIHITIIKSK